MLLSLRFRVRTPRGQTSADRSSNRDNYLCLCHQTDGRRPDGGAQTFLVVANMPSTTAFSLKVFLVADVALECAQIETQRRGFDVGEHHPTMAVGHLLYFLALNVTWALRWPYLSAASYYPGFAHCPYVASSSSSRIEGASWSTEFSNDWCTTIVPL
jgi:hypothetical protein